MEISIIKQSESQHEGIKCRGDGMAIKARQAEMQQQQQQGTLYPVLPDAKCVFCANNDNV